MKICTGKLAFLYGVLALSLLSGCGPTEPSQRAAIANPASGYCVKKGGTLEIVKEAAGEKGMCHLPDGTAIDEWELFRRDNPQE